MTVSHFARGCSIVDNWYTVSFKAAPPLGSYCGQPTVNREQHTHPRGEKKLRQTVHSHYWQLPGFSPSHAPVSSPFTAALWGILKLIVKHTGFNIIPEICSPNKADDFLPRSSSSQIPLSPTSFIYLPSHPPSFSFSSGCICLVWGIFDWQVITRSGADIERMSYLYVL